MSEYKLKILFYGNCQINSICKYFGDHLRNEFDVISCKECGLATQWNNSVSFAVWTPANKPHQLDYFECIHKKLKETDIFIFQSHSGKTAIEKLHTEYLCNEILSKNSIKICLPDFRFFANANDSNSLKPWVDYAKTKTSNSNEIIDFLQNSDDPHLVELFQNEMPYHKEYVRYRNENYFRYEEEHKKYDIRINMNDWVEERFEKEIITHQHNHPTEIYFKELTSRIFKCLHINEDEFPIKSIDHPKSNGINPEQFKFFRTQFPSMDYSGISGRPIIDQDIN